MGGFSYGYYDRQVLEESVASTSPMCHLSYLNIFYSRYGHDALVKSVSFKKRQTHDLTKDIHVSK